MTDKDYVEINNYFINQEEKNKYHPNWESQFPFSNKNLKNKEYSQSKSCLDNLKVSNTFKENLINEDIFKKKSNYQNIENVKSCSSNNLKCLKSNIDSTQFLPKICSQQNVNTCPGKTNFEKFISTPNKLMTISKNLFYLKSKKHENEAGQNRISNKDLSNLNLTNSSSFKISATQTPSLNSNQSYIKSRTKLKNNLLKDKYLLEDHINRDPNKNIENGSFLFQNSKEKINQNKNTIYNSHVIFNSQIKNDNNTLNFKLKSKNNKIVNSTSKNFNKVNVENFRNIQN